MNVRSQKVKDSVTPGTCEKHVLDLRNLQKIQQAKQRTLSSPTERWSQKSNHQRKNTSCALMANPSRGPTVIVKVFRLLTTETCCHTGVSRTVPGLFRDGMLLKTENHMHARSHVQISGGDGRSEDLNTPIRSSLAVGWYFACWALCCTP